MLLNVPLVLMCVIFILTESRVPSEITKFPTNLQYLNSHPSFLPELSNSKSFVNCPTMGALGTSLKRSFIIPRVQEGFERFATDLQERSYPNGFGAPAATTYYPTFDPISVLASLAFLAFLLQSFASLYDRSRSMIPTIISSRESSSRQKDHTELTRHILNALEEYKNLNDDFIQNEENNDVSSTE